MHTHGEGKGILRCVRNPSGGHPSKVELWFWFLGSHPCSCLFPRPPDARTFGPESPYWSSDGGRTFVTCKGRLVPTRVRSVLVFGSGKTILFSLHFTGQRSGWWVPGLGLGDEDTHGETREYRLLTRRHGRHDPRPRQEGSHLFPVVKIDRTT